MTSRERSAPPAGRRPHRVVALVAAVLVAFAALVGATPASATPSDAPSAPTVENASAARAVRALTSDRPDAALVELPADFAREFGYTPVLRDGVPVRADGDCSSPIPLPGSFEDPCKTHDFGYDLLRYANRHGEPLGAWARGRIDDQLAARMTAVCGSDVGCRGLAKVAAAGVALNSDRQRGGPPIRESVVDVIAALIPTFLGGSL